MSLRDTARFISLMTYFLKSNLAIDDPLKEIEYSYKKRAVVMSLSFCYYYRISSSKDREDYVLDLGRVAPKFINSTAFEQILI